MLENVSLNQINFIFSGLAGQGYLCDVILSFNLFNLAQKYDIDVATLVPTPGSTGDEFLPNWN